MRRFIRLLAISLTVSLGAGFAACQETEDRDAPADRTPSAEPVDTAAAPGPQTPTSGLDEAPDAPRAPRGDTVSSTAPRPDLRGYDTVFVYFDGPMPDGATMGPLLPRPRAVPDTGALTFALAELLAGPTASDTASDGMKGPLYSWFSRETEGMLLGVGLDDGVAIVEFDDFRRIIPGASSSAGSAALLRQLEATVFQFPEVRRVEFRIHGSCQAFMAWLQIGCVPIPRSGFEPPPGHRMAVPE